MERNIFKEIASILDSDESIEAKRELLSDYHENDIADVAEELSEDERKELYNILGAERTAELFAYLDDVDEFVDELEYDQAADIIEQMDADDAVDLLNELDEYDKKEIIDRMEDEAVDDIRLIESYDEDKIGAHMTTNYITIRKGSSVKTAMKSLLAQAADNDNISILYVVENDDTYYGTVDLKDLIIAREGTPLENLTKFSYPTLQADDVFADCLNDIREYALESIPVLNKSNRLIGVITSADVIETMDEELSDDYAKLGGLTEKNDLDEGVFKSMRKRIPWLVVLMFLGLVVSVITGRFEAVIAALPVVVFFQSMILDMAGNVGTQSLAVTIRVLSEEDKEKKLHRKLIFKELRVGFFNGLVLGLLAAVFVSLYLGISGKTVSPDAVFSWIECLKAGGIVGLSLLIAMTLSGFTGTAFPILLTKMKVDPAVASGPFITTLNDILAITVYYTMAFLMFLAV